MADPNTIRILELDGGGERGYLSLNFLQKFIQLWGIDPATLASQFDVICGTSIGGIMSLSFAFGLTPDEISPFFTVQGPYIFSLSSVTPSLRPNLAAKLALIVADIPFYQSSGPTAPYYGSGLLAATLQSTFGTSTMQNLNTAVIIPTYENVSSTFILCSNLNYPGLTGQNELLSNVSLATAAAPAYLPPVVLSNMTPGTLNGTYLDGGIYQNNPAQFGVVLGKAIKPNANRICVFSLGTGTGEYGFDPGNPDMSRIFDTPVYPILEKKLRTKGRGTFLLEAQLQTPLDFDTIQTIFALYTIASTGGQEAPAQALLFESNYTLDQLYYYRFQPVLPTDINTELDNTDPEILTYYEDLAVEVFDDDIENISAFLGHLTA